MNSHGEVLGINTFVWEDAAGISLSTQVRALCQKILDCTASQNSIDGWRDAGWVWGAGG